jgi:hypothetical protein
VPPLQPPIRKPSPDRFIVPSLPLRVIPRIGSEGIETGSLAWSLCFPNRRKEKHAIHGSDRRVRPGRGSARFPAKTHEPWGMGFDWVGLFQPPLNPRILGRFFAFSKICGFEIEIEIAVQTFSTSPRDSDSRPRHFRLKFDFGYSARRIFHGIFTYGTTTFFPRFVQFHVVTQHTHTQMYTSSTAGGICIQPALSIVHGRAGRG